MRRSTAFVAGCLVACSAAPSQSPASSSENGSTEVGSAPESTNSGPQDSTESSTGSTPDPTTGGSSDTGEAPPACPGGVFPDAQWPLGDPAEFGLDPDGLEAAAAFADEHESRCVVVVRDGHLVFESYFGDTDESTLVKTYSVAKSHTSSLVGIAIDQGFLGGVDDAVVDLLPQLESALEHDVRLRDLLTMTSGIYGGVLEDYVLLTFAGDHSQFALDAGQNSPAGSAWQYSNVGVQLFEPILRRATGVSVDEYARTNLWQPIGMDAQWDTDGAGNVMTYQNVRATCRDHARFGYLYLRRGCWDGERILDEEWIAEATATSQDFNRGYGYLFWVAGQVPTLTSVSFDEMDGGLHPFAPAGTFAARGLGGQIIEVIPELDMVVVHTGYAPQDAPDAWQDPLALVQELLQGNDDDVPGVVLERILEAVVD